MKIHEKHKGYLLDLDYYNSWLKEKSPDFIIKWALSLANRPIITSNFRPYAVTLLHACTQVKKDIPVIWCDTGFNTQSTYEHIKEVKNLLQLNLFRYEPNLSSEFVSYYYGVPKTDDRLHKLFTELVKMEPFRRALNEHKPDVWFTNVRQGQTQHRNRLDILSYTKDGILKVSPFYYAKNKELFQYTKQHALPIEFDYYDPTKGEANRECGIQLL